MKTQKIGIGELWKIKDDVNKLASNLSRELARKANETMVQVYNSIIDDFYNSYTPTAYHRSKNLYKALINHRTYSISENESRAIIKIGAANMGDYKKTTAGNVFDLMWVHGVRGLPKTGSSPLSKTFTWYTPHGRKTWHAGDVWENPFWSDRNDPYHNIFETAVNVEDYSTTSKMIPQRVMIDFVNNWGIIGRNECKRIVNRII